MSLKDRLAGDIEKVFYKEKDFAERHDYDGTPILCIIDNDEALRHRNLNAVSVEWDTGMTQMVVLIPCGQLERKPVEGQEILFDGELKRVESVQENLGEYIVVLNQNEGRLTV